MSDETKEILSGGVTGVIWGSVALSLSYVTTYIIYWF